MVAPYLIHSPRKSKSPLSKVSCQDIHIPSHVDILAADSFEHALFIDTIRYRNEAAGFEKKGSGGHHFDARREKKRVFLQFACCRRINRNTIKSKNKRLTDHKDDDSMVSWRWDEMRWTYFDAFIYYWMSWNTDDDTPPGDLVHGVPIDGEGIIYVRLPFADAVFWEQKEASFAVTISSCHVYIKPDTIKERKCPNRHNSGGLTMECSWFMRTVSGQK